MLGKPLLPGAKAITRESNVKNSAVQVFFGFIFCLLCLPAFAGDDEIQDMLPQYRVQPGDQLGVTVWREDDLSSGAVVLPDGTASFALVGQMYVAGKTVDQIKEEYVQRLSTFIPDPVVTIRLGELGGNQIYIIGKVGRPGVFQVSRYVDVMQALSMAGGMTPFASVNKINILRRVNGTEQVISFRYGDVEKGKNLEQNIILQSGDVIVVP